MTPKPPRVKAEDLSLNPQAKLLASEVADSYENSLIIQAKVLAAQQGMDEVQRVHIERAHDLLIRVENEGWVKQLLLIFGSASIGAFIQGFITELSAGHKALTAIYVALGFVGMLMVFWALLKQR
jgi:hypothetical protein